MKKLSRTRGTASLLHESGGPSRTHVAGPFICSDAEDALPAGKRLSAARDKASPRWKMPTLVIADSSSQHGRRVQTLLFCRVYPGHT